MIRNIKRLLWMLGVIFLFSSCEKDNITNSYINENPKRVESIVSALKKTLVSSPDGWVMMVKSSLSADVYTPVVLKFDTVKNLVRIKTVYGITNDTEDYFRISIGTGSPQLIFSTGSIMTTLYRIGIQASDITDHIYNVVKVSEEEIQIQPYRSGNVYTKEGGVVYTLFKRPADWVWAEDVLNFDWTNITTTANVNGVLGRMSIDYLNTGTNLTTPWRFGSWFDPTVFRIRDPFSIEWNAGTGGFTPMNYLVLAGLVGVGSGVTSTTNSMITNGHNTLSFYPIPYNSVTNQNIIAIATFLKTHYLIFKNEVRVGNNVKIEFEAYDKSGKVILRAFYDNLR